MNKNEILIIFVLCILLIVVVLQIFKTRNKEQFYINHDPFPRDECSGDNYADPIGAEHVNHNRDALQSFHTHNIHMVNPYNPCCLRTCINDFTFTEENVDMTNPSEVEKIGLYKDTVNRHLYFASKCNMCLDNFYVALKRLSSDDYCDESDTNTSTYSGGNGCEIQI